RPRRTGWTLRAWRPVFSGRPCRPLTARLPLRALWSDRSLWPRWTNWTFLADCSLWSGRTLRALRALRSRWPLWPGCRFAASHDCESRDDNSGNPQELSHPRALGLRSDLCWHETRPAVEPSVRDVRPREAVTGITDST